MIDENAEVAGKLIEVTGDISSHGWPTGTIVTAVRLLHGDILATILPYDSSKRYKWSEGETMFLSPRESKFVEDDTITHVFHLINSETIAFDNIDTRTFRSENGYVTFETNDSALRIIYVANVIWWEVK